MTKEQVYNYPRFKASYYDLDHFKGPKPSQGFSLFSLKNTEGETVNLTSFKKKWIVLETGSFTCPQYIDNIDKMKDLQKKFPEIVFLILYVREAHPGNKVKPAISHLEKQTLAKRVQQDYQETRPILVDTIEGVIHQSIGSRPNSVYVITPQGKVFFRSDWNVPEKLEEALRKRDQESYLENDHFEPKLAHPLVAIKVILKAGILALFDIIKALPKLMLMHLKSKKITKF